MIGYSLPDFTAGLNLNLFFIKLLADSPDLFDDDIRIDSVYGCFPGCVVNGGRTYISEPATREQMERTFSALRDEGVVARLTFTNMLTEPQHLDDPYFNEILDVAAHYDAEVIVYSELVDRYIRERYDMPRTLSTTREIRDLDELNRATGEFDCVVLNYNLNKDAAFLAGIEHPERIEIMANELCNPDCPFRQDHYLHNSRDQINGVLTPFSGCDLSGSDFSAHSSDHPTVLNRDEIHRLHDDLGFSRFKIVGRGVDFGVTLDSYLHYLIKPIYVDAIRKMILDNAR